MIKSFWVGVFLLISTQAWAVLPHGATPAEEAMCAAKGMPAGQGYQGHYCDGLRFLDRAYSSMGNKREMGYYLGVAIDNFNYELNRARAPSASRRAELYVLKARALKLMGKKAEAATEFNKALNYKTSSPEVYQALADHFHETGNKKKALEMATEGLMRNPDSRGLKRRYTESGGKLPYPEALAETVPDVETDVKPVDKSESTAEETSDIPGSNKPPTIAPLPGAAKIGSPTNPYCRFCPD